MLTQSDISTWVQLPGFQRTNIQIWKQAKFVSALYTLILHLCEDFLYRLWHTIFHLLLNISFQWRHIHSQREPLETNYILDFLSALDHIVSSWKWPLMELMYTHIFLSRRNKISWMIFIALKTLHYNIQQLCLSLTIDHYMLILTCVLIVSI